MNYRATGTFEVSMKPQMNRGAQQLSISVVPDSGTEQLMGIAGELTLKIVDGQHHYELEYSLPE